MEQMVVETAKQAGATHITFNPLTERVCLREASRVVKEARQALQESEIRAVVQDVHCDLRNAIQALQLHLAGQKQKGGRGKSSSARRGHHQGTIGEKHWRDMGLSIFHALGKILYNKRLNKEGKEVQLQQYASPSA